MPHPGGTLALALADPAGAYEAVRLVVDANLPGPRALRRDREGTWRLAWPVPGPLHRLEYRFEVTVGGHATTLTDPTNPRRAGSAFGDWSVWESQAYAPPAWLREPLRPGRVTSFTVPTALRRPVPVAVWSPAGVTRRRLLPLLLVHDGPEYAVRGDLLRWSAAAVEAGRVPPHRVALVQPVDRMRWYSASPGYLRATETVLRAVRSAYATGPVVTVGASLGGLTALLVALHASAEGLGIVGCLAQSGSFFTPETSPDDSGWAHFGRVARAVERLSATGTARTPLRVALTCGALEGNLANNRAMAGVLRRAGHDTSLREVGDLHCWTAWRDALDPDLTALLASAGS